MGPPPGPDFSAADLTGETLIGEGAPSATPVPNHRTPSRAPEYVDEDELGPGAMLGSLYRVRRKLGEGGMGTVYEVEHVRMRKRFAAKVLRRELCTPEHVKRLEREAITASSIEHPNIMQIVNLDETAQGRVFLVGELLEGHDLSRLVREGPVQLEVAFSIVMSVASALDATHRENIVHRDLKPENIFLHNKDGAVVVKVLDFGVSKVEAGEDAVRLTEAGTVIGTPAYMSPESTEGRTDLDQRVDVYSLGVILYEMASGELPFAASSPIEMMIKHVQEIPEPPSAKLASVPAALDALVLKALEKDPADRYETMGEFADALQAVADELELGEASIPILPAPEVTGAHSVAAFRSKTPGPVSVTVDPAGEGRGRRWFLAAAAVAVLAVGISVAAGTGLLGGSAFEQPSPAPAPAPPPAAAAAPAPVVPAPAPPPPAPAKPTEVELTLESTPPGAEVRLGDEKLGTTPTTVKVPFGEAETELSFRRKGYKPAKKRFVPAEDQTLSVELKRKGKGRRRGGGAPRILGTR